MQFGSVAVWVWSKRRGMNVTPTRTPAMFLRYAWDGQNNPTYALLKREVLENCTILHLQLQWGGLSQLRKQNYYWQEIQFHCLHYIILFISTLLISSSLFISVTLSIKLKYFVLKKSTSIVYSFYFSLACSLSEVLITWPLFFNIMTIPCLPKRVWGGFNSSP